MQRVAIFSFAVLLGLSAIVAKADPVVTVGAYNLNTNTLQNQISITVYDDPTTGNGYDDATGNQGTPGMPGLRLYVSLTNTSNAIAAGSPVFHLGLPAPGTGQATGSTGYVSGTNPGPVGKNDQQGGDPIGHGAIWSTAAGTGHSPPGDGGTSSNKQLRITLSGAVGGPFPTPTTNSGSPDLLATLWIDTTGVAPGSNWIIRITGTPTGGPSIPALDMADAGALANTLFNGTIHINALVPEPSSIVMGLFAAAGLAAVAIRRRRLA